MSILLMAQMSGKRVLNKTEKDEKERNNDLFDHTVYKREQANLRSSAAYWTGR